ncbi:iron-sulfur cluster assembly accessory protein [bacterium]|nr:iron-sulfur cluster assembly accessory protein [bacterium]
MTEQTAETKPAPFIRVSDEAAKWIGIFHTEQKLDPADYAFRVGVKAGGCSGFEYVMRMDRPKPEDRVFEHNGAKVVVDEKSLRLLNGSTLHFIMKYQGAGFTILSPRVAATCGCGTSVSFKSEPAPSTSTAPPG